MQRRELNDLLWFIAVAEERSFTRAAAKLGTSQSTLSHTIKQLEQRLGLRLLTRTTRSVSPTEAGERLLSSMAPRIADIEQDIAGLMALREKPSGLVRITISDHAYDWLVWPKLRPVLADYPDIHLEFSIDNGLRNIVEKRFDAGVRLGESLEKDMVAVRIGPDWRLVAVASPTYLAQRGIPESPQDLVHHNCMNHRQGRSGGLYAWEFAKDGRELRVRVEGQLTFNSSLPMVEAAVAGHGIAYVPDDIVTEHLSQGVLVQVLNGWSRSFPGYHLSYPSRRQLSPAMSVVVAALRHHQ
ncbi:LysR family transcriptional regulator [Devosia sp. Root685]|uniref:LysR family transcriptional regulator n=1 Tax=Devosia sp. Root685 TaxID=1736587 RepID=UPI0006F6DDD9|nr:LysR family transcriptional regulator [Devosia sp. Root685]KRA98076.1 LysR family transcriptional regulator [Devosia sp. Root685]